MRKGALDFYCCPQCRGVDLDLHVFEVVSFSNFLPDGKDSFSGKNGDEVEFVKSGCVVCRSCNIAFEISEFVPNFRIDMATSASEMSSSKQIEKNGDVLPENDELESLLRQKIKKALPLDRAVGKKAQKNAEHDIEYRLKHARKDKYVRLFRKYLATSQLNTVLEVGIGQGGFSTSVKEMLHPRRVFGLDYESSWAQIAKTRDFSMEVVIADARKMPFRDEVFDFVYSAYTLEHIPGFEPVISETSRIAKQAFYIFGPSRFSPYDFHFEKAPLIPMFPQFLAERFAYFWKVKKAGYDYRIEEIRDEYATMNYISPRHFENTVEANGLHFRALFAEFLRYSFDESYQYHSIMRVFRLFRFIFIPVMRLLEILRIHPIMVYFLDSTKNKTDKNNGTRKII